MKRLYTIFTIFAMIMVISMGAPKVFADGLYVSDTAEIRSDVIYGNFDGEISMIKNLSDILDFNADGTVNVLDVKKGYQVILDGETEEISLKDIMAVKMFIVGASNEECMKYLDVQDVEAEKFFWSDIQNGAFNNEGDVLKVQWNEGKKIFNAEVFNYARMIAIDPMYDNAEILVKAYDTSAGQIYIVNINGELCWTASQPMTIYNVKPGCASEEMDQIVHSFIHGAVEAFFPDGSMELINYQTGIVLYFNQHVEISKDVLFASKGDLAYFGAVNNQHDYAIYKDGDSYSVFVGIDK